MTERERFEAWARTQGVSLNCQDLRTNPAWIGWQAAMASVADKLLDAERLSHHLQGNPLTVRLRKVTVIHGPNKEPEYATAFRAAIDAALTDKGSP